MIYMIVCLTFSNMQTKIFTARDATSTKFQNFSL